AGAFLIPESKMKKELGSKRSNISLEELVILKQKYGISMKTLMMRAKDLSIISENYYNIFFKEMSQLGYSKKEPFDSLNDEEPQRLKFLVFKAFSQGIISPLKASELLDTPFDQFSEELMNEFTSAPAFAFRCLSSLRCEGHLSASCPPPNSKIIIHLSTPLIASTGHLV
ncbi:MAG: ImmA/IrrE family metallo-endopeptidase, partial [Athalassotoga sp.]|uniref:ImmA/IrrE family metallo-endopeptidase n=1 Tax=Athalassotoga sp. TaxID=2022597 RepID=UPI003D054265